MIDNLLHEWCGRPHDVCPCLTGQLPRRQVEARHRAAVRLARPHGWAGNARRRHIDHPHTRRTA